VLVLDHCNTLLIFYFLTFQFDVSSLQKKEIFLSISPALSVYYRLVFCRPELVDYRQARQRSARENLDMAFKLFEREFGITRLLDPEGRIFRIIESSLW